MGAISLPDQLRIQGTVPNAGGWGDRWSRTGHGSMPTLVGGSEGPNSLRGNCWELGLYLEPEVAVILYSAHHGLLWLTLKP